MVTGPCSIISIRASTAVFSSKVAVKVLSPICTYICMPLFSSSLVSFPTASDSCAKLEGEALSNSGPADSCSDPDTPSTADTAVSEDVSTGVEGRSSRPLAACSLFPQPASNSAKEKTVINSKDIAFLIIFTTLLYRKFIEIA